MYGMFRLLLSLGKKTNPYLSFESLYELSQVPDSDIPSAIQDKQKQPFLSKNLEAVQRFVARFMPMYAEISTPLRHICTHSTLKIEREMSATDYSKLSGKILKSVSHR